MFKIGVHTRGRLENKSSMHKERKRLRDQTSDDGGVDEEISETSEKGDEERVKGGGRSARTNAGVLR